MECAGLAVEQPCRGSCAAARTSETQPSLCVKLVPADENALRCVFAWRNRQSVYLLVL